jgi:hypothetical protein
MILCIDGKPAAIYVNELTIHVIRGFRGQVNCGTY